MVGLDPVTSPSHLSQDLCLPVLLLVLQNFTCIKASSHEHLIPSDLIYLPKFDTAHLGLLITATLLNVLSTSLDVPRASLACSLAACSLSKQHMGRAKPFDRRLHMLLALLDASSRCSSRGRHPDSVSAARLAASARPRHSSFASGYERRLKRQICLFSWRANDIPHLCQTALPMLATNCQCYHPPIPCERLL